MKKTGWAILLALCCTGGYLVLPSNYYLRRALIHLLPKIDQYPIFENLRHRGRPISRHGLYALVKKWSSLVISRGDVSPHWFRHSCFTQLASRGARLESIQALAGHANIQTTMHYNEAAQLMSPASAIFDEE